MKNLEKILGQIPKLCGVYLFKDSQTNIIYIGKALNLFNRVNSYFNKNNDIKTQALVKKIKNIEYFVTNNEIEALLLENNLIKQHQPKYNIQLKDSKSFPFLKITSENLPRIIKCREKINPDDEYYGPFVNMAILNFLQKIFVDIFKIRSCKKIFKPPYNYTPCLIYHIEKCLAPCAGYITEEEYLRNINMAREILKGNIKKIISLLKEKMNEHSQNLEFEKAAKIRDELKILEEYDTMQFIDTASQDDADYIGIFSDFNNACVSIISERRGKIINKRNFIITHIVDYTSLLNDFLSTYYLDNTDMPFNIFIQEEINDARLIEYAVKEKFNTNIKIKTPVSIKEKKLVKLAKENAEIYFEEKQYKLENIHTLRELKKELNLKKLPRVIEGFDIATLDGKHNTASMVSFIDGNPNRAGYRQFNITDQEHPNDYAMIEEVIARRYQRLKNEKRQMPDLILVDGGKGQVSAAKKILEILGLDIDLIGLAKKNEYIFLKDAKNPVILNKGSMSLKLLQKIRDESHRFSNTRLNRRYVKKTTETRLSQIKGLGKKRINMLLKKFGSTKGIANASVDDIASIGMIGNELAIKIKKDLNNIKE
jgi:excinuclease ABC subunit C